MRVLLAAVKDLDIDFAEAPWSAGAYAGGDISECPMTPVETSIVRPVQEENRRKLAMVS